MADKKRLTPEEIVKSFKDEFKAIMFQAYEEKPLLPTKQYKYYNVPVYFED